MISNEKRIKYYMSDFYDKEIVIEKKQFQDLRSNEVVYCDNSNPNCLLPNRLSWLKHRGWWGDSETNGEFDININCLFLAAWDCSYYILRDQNNPKVHFDAPIFSCTRIINSNMILSRVNIAGSFADNINLLKKLQNKEVKWREKKPEVIWRGVDSGLSRKSTTPNRLDLVKKYHKKYNIGFNHVMKDITKAQIEPGMIKDHITQENQADYKYIVFMEGNDSGSALKWLLGSGSLVLMYKPQFEMWHMEGLLEEYIHYVPLSNPLDLEEKLDWCEKNQDVCEEIVDNASKWVSQFLDIKNEIYLHNELIRRYSKQFKFI